MANYVRFTYENHVTTTVRGADWYAGPRDFPPQPNHLFRNRGDGTFADVTAESGIGAHAGSGMGTLCFDYDHDGDTDIFVCNDQALNFLFQNDGTGKFQEVALEAGVACNYAGEPVGSMGADAADYDHDGWLDFFMTDFQRQKPILFHNLGHGLFEDATLRTGAAAGTFPYVKWGCGMVDFDNDGWPDIFIGCGHLGEDLNATADRTSYLVRPVLLRNTGRGTFVNVSDTAGDGLQVPLVARGIAFDDLDNDGRVDVVIQNLRRPPTVLRNESPAGHHWLQLQLRGTQDEPRRRRHARPASSPARWCRSPRSTAAAATRAISARGSTSAWPNTTAWTALEVQWLGGGSTVLKDLPVDQRLTITE